MESSANVQFETALLKNDMQMFPVEINGNLFSFQGKKYVMLIARDITERLTQKEELERHRAMAIYKNRMAAVGEMVANIAHQWRQPLSSLNLMLSNLEDAYETDTLDVEYFNRQMQKSRGIIQRMSEIIDEFRYFFSPKGQRKSFAVQESMRQVEEMVHDRLRIESVQLHVSRETEDDLVYGYPNQLSQVLLNLISNAMDAFSDISGEKLIHVDIDETEAFVVVTVKDNAGGIEDDVLPKLFEPYFTTKAENGGTGIGLYMSKMIIESKFAGRIQAKRIDNGLSFTIELPKYNQGDDTWKQLIRKLKILYVEDDLVHREELSDYLSRRVGRLYLAENGEQGLEKFETVNPDLVITDLRMPKMSGIELAEKIREINKTVPIIVLTALSDKDTILETVKIGILDYVLKPVDVKELIKVIRKAVSTITAIDNEFGYQVVAPEKLNTLKSVLTSYLKKETGKGPIDVRFTAAEDSLELVVMGTLTRYEEALMQRQENQKLVEYNRSVFFKDRSGEIGSLIENALETRGYVLYDVTVDALKDRCVLLFKLDR